MLRSLSMFLVMTSALPVFGGALYLDISSPANNSEAQTLHAVAVARVSACHEPAKSVVTAAAIDSRDALHRTPLKVVKLAADGTFAIVGVLPAGTSVIDIAVTNPDYNNYQPHAFVRANGSGVEWASVKRFFGTAATPGDVRAMFEKP